MDENLKAPEENPRIEQIRAQLVDVYTNQIPTFEHRKGLITPHAMTVSTLLGELIELDEFFLQLFHDNPTVRIFTFHYAPILTVYCSMNSRLNLATTRITYGPMSR